MRITHVVRGEDHISNTPRQILVYEAFGWSPPAFAHLSLVLGPDHAPLSKRHGATSVAEFRAKGYLPEALANYLALIGWSPGDGDEVLPLDELARRFDLAPVGHSAGVFDEAKLAWVNRHYLKQRRSGSARGARPAVSRAAAGSTAADVSPAAQVWLRAVLPPLATSIDRLDELPERMTQSSASMRPRPCSATTCGPKPPRRRRGRRRGLGRCPRRRRPPDLARRLPGAGQRGGHGDRRQGQGPVPHHPSLRDRRARGPGAGHPGTGHRRRRRFDPGRRPRSGTSAAASARRRLRGAGSVTRDARDSVIL